MGGGDPNCGVARSLMVGEPVPRSASLVTLVALASPSAPSGAWSCAGLCGQGVFLWGEQSQAGEGEHQDQPCGPGHRLRRLAPPPWASCRHRAGVPPGWASQPGGFSQWRLGAASACLPPSCRCTLLVCSTQGFWVRMEVPGTGRAVEGGRPGRGRHRFPLPAWTWGPQGAYCGLRTLPAHRGAEL